MSEIKRVDNESLQRAASLIDNGGLIVIPTDTVYGVACDPFNDQAIDRIYHIKQRPRFKALQVIVSSVDELDALGLYLPAPLNRLAAAFLPGAFSPIALAKKDSKLGTLRLEQDGSRTQAIRIPNSVVSLRILRATGPVAASSANRSGEESPQTVQEAYEAFGDDVELYLDGGPTQGHVASTVVCADSNEKDGVAILRQGVIGPEDIRTALYINGGGLGA